MVEGGRDGRGTMSQGTNRRLSDPDCMAEPSLCGEGQSCTQNGCMTTCNAEGEVCPGVYDGELVPGTDGLLCVSGTDMSGAVSYLCTFVCDPVCEEGKQCSHAMRECVAPGDGLAVDIISTPACSTEGCAAGMQCDYELAMCVVCPSGRWKSATGYEEPRSCTLCPEDSPSNGAAMTDAGQDATAHDSEDACTAIQCGTETCGAGQVCDADVCVTQCSVDPEVPTQPCPDDKPVCSDGYCGMADMTPAAGCGDGCVAGMQCEGGDCVVCHAGSYKYTFGLGVCQECDEARINDVMYDKSPAKTGTDAISHDEEADCGVPTCPAGMTGCIDDACVGRGEVHQYGEFRCVVCAVSTYKGTTGVTACSMCGGEGGAAMTDEGLDATAHDSEDDCVPGDAGGGGFSYSYSTNFGPACAKGQIPNGEGVCEYCEVDHYLVDDSDYARCATCSDTCLGTSVGPARFLSAGGDLTTATCTSAAGDSECRAECVDGAFYNFSTTSCAVCPDNSYRGGGSGKGDAARRLARALKIVPEINLKLDFGVKNRRLEDRESVGVAPIPSTTTAPAEKDGSEGGSAPECLLACFRDVTNPVGDNLPDPTCEQIAAIKDCITVGDLACEDELEAALALANNAMLETCEVPECLETCITTNSAEDDSTCEEVMDIRDCVDLACSEDELEFALEVAKQDMVKRCPQDVECTACPGGSTTSSTTEGVGATSLSDCTCSPGSGFIRGVCTPCPIGNYSSDGVVCADCSTLSAPSCAPCQDDDASIASDSGGELSCASGFSRLGYQCEDDSTIVELGFLVGWFAAKCPATCGYCGDAPSDGSCTSAQLSASESCRPKCVAGTYYNGTTCNVCGENMYREGDDGNDFECTSCAGDKLIVSGDADAHSSEEKCISPTASPTTSPTASPTTKPTYSPCEDDGQIRNEKGFCEYCAVDDYTVDGTWCAPCGSTCLETFVVPGVKRFLSELNDPCTSAVGDSVCREKCADGSYYDYTAAGDTGGCAVCPADFYRVDVPPPYKYTESRRLQGILPAPTTPTGEADGMPSCLKTCEEGEDLFDTTCEEFMRIRDCATSNSGCGGDDLEVAKSMIEGAKFEACPQDFECTACPDVSTTKNMNGATKCVCAAGNTLDFESQECIPCPIGQYRPDSNENWCQYCPSGSSTAVEGAIDVLQCVCQEGHVLSDEPSNIGSVYYSCVPRSAPLTLVFEEKFGQAWLEIGVMDFVEDIGTVYCQASPTAMIFDPTTALQVNFAKSHIRDNGQAQNVVSSSEGERAVRRRHLGMSPRSGGSGGDMPISEPVFLKFNFTGLQHSSRYSVACFHDFGNQTSSAVVVDDQAITEIGFPFPVDDGCARTTTNTSITFWMAAMHEAGTVWALAKEAPEDDEDIGFPSNVDIKNNGVKFEGVKKLNDAEVEKLGTSNSDGYARTEGLGTFCHSKSHQDAELQCLFGCFPIPMETKRRLSVGDTVSGMRMTCTDYLEALDCADRVCEHVVAAEMRAQAAEICVQSMESASEPCVQASYGVPESEPPFSDCRSLREFWANVTDQCSSGSAFVSSESDFVFDVANALMTSMAVSCGCSDNDSDGDADKECTPDRGNVPGRLLREKLDEHAFKNHFSDAFTSDYSRAPSQVFELPSLWKSGRALQGKDGPSDGTSDSVSGSDDGSDGDAVPECLLSLSSTCLDVRGLADGVPTCENITAIWDCEITPIASLGCDCELLTSISFMKARVCNEEISYVECDNNSPKPDVNYDSFTIPGLKPLTKYHIFFYSEDEGSVPDFHPYIPTFEYSAIELGFYGTMESFEPDLSSLSPSVKPNSRRLDDYADEGDGYSSPEYSSEYSPDTTMADLDSVFFDDVRKASIKFYRTETTACCGSVTAGESFSTTTMKAGTWSNTLVLHLSQAPSASVVINLAAYFTEGEACSVDDRAGDAVDVLSVPSKTFQASDDLRFEFTAKFAKQGCGVIEVTITGANADEYHTTPQYYALVVAASDAVTPPPTIVTAKFGDSGNKLVVTLDTASDQGKCGLGLSGTSYVAFACSQLFSIPTIGPDAMCRFVSPTVIQVTLSTSAATVEGDTLELLESKIYALRGKEDLNCENWEPSGAQTVVIAYPDYPIIPVVSITGATSVPSCNDIELDASTSSGSGGRAWKSFQWTFNTGDEASKERVQAHLKSINEEPSFDPLLTVPSALLTKGETYGFTLTLTNFMDSKTVYGGFGFVVTVAQQSVPLVNVIGEAKRSMLRSESLSLFAEGTAAACEGEEPKIIAKEKYAWSVTQDGVEVTSVVSTSVDKRYFRLNAYTLKPGSIYLFTVLVTDSMGLTNEASVEVEIDFGSLVAVVSGGNRAVSLNDEVALSASSSYRTDYPDLRGLADGFSFAWTCVETSPQLGRACTGFDDLNASGEALTLSPDSLVALTSAEKLGEWSTMTFAFAVEFDQAESDAVEVSTVLEISASEPPEVFIEPMLAAKVNPSRKLQLQGSVVPDDSNDIEVTWSSDQLSDLGEVATSQLVATIPADSSATAISFNLILAAGTLTGELYTFRLTGSTASNKGYADVAIVVNSPPVPGIVTVDNGAEVSVVERNNGVALDTRFKLTADGWIDDESDLPLTYSFYYVVGVIEEGSRTATTQVSFESLAPAKSGVLLPVGGGQNSTVTVIARVGDKFGSKADAFTKAFVTAPVYDTEELAEVTNGLTSAALEEGDTDLVFQVLEGASSVLNGMVSLDCSDAPACGELNRLECSEGGLENTCAKCIVGFIGSKAGNNECVEETALCQNGLHDAANGETDVDCGGDCDKCNLGKQCELGEDCYFGICSDGGVCAAPEKQCPRTPDGAVCNGHGSCIALDNNDEPMDKTECLEDVVCTVKCDCDETLYGAVCSKLESDRAEAVELRKNMLDTLQEVAGLQDVTSESVGQQASSLSALASEVEELDSESQATAVQAVRDITNNLQATSAGGLDESAALQLGATVSSLMTVAGTGDNSTQGTKEAEEISKAIDNLASAQITSLFVGEAAAEIVTPNLKISSQKVSMESLANSSFSPPQSEDDVLSGRESPQLMMPEEGLGGLFESDCSVGVTVSELGKHVRSDNATLESTVMRFGLGCYKTQGASDESSSDGGRRSRRSRRKLLPLAEEEADSDDAAVIVVMQNARAVREGGGNSTEEFIGDTKEISIQCEWDQFEDIVTTCPGDGGKIVTTPCDGWKKNHTITCGSVASRGCAVGGPSTAWNSSSCVVIDTDEKSTTCSCKILKALTSTEEDEEEGELDKRRRRMNTIYDDQQSSEVGTTDNIDFGGIFSGVSNNFVATWSVAGKLDAATVAKNIVVFLVMGVTLVGGALMCIRGKIKDKYDIIRHKHIKQAERDEKAGFTNDKQKNEFILKQSTPLFIQYMDNMWMNCKQQLFKRHDFTSAVLYYSPIKSRPQRVALLVCTGLGMLFAESVVFDLAFPDFDPKCETFTTKETCLTEKSIWNELVDRCHWSGPSQSCSFVEPEATLLITIGVAVIACIFTAPLGVVLVIIFNESIFPATKGTSRAEFIDEQKETDWKQKDKMRKQLDMTWDIFGTKHDEPEGTLEAGATRKARTESDDRYFVGDADKGKETVTREEYEQEQKDHKMGFARDSESSQPDSGDEEIGLHGSCIRAGCVRFCGCCWCCRKTKFDVRVDAEVTKAMYAVRSRKKEIESTVALLKKRLDEGDTSAKTPYNAAVFRERMFKRDWHLDANIFTKCVKKSMRSKVKMKIKEDLKLADAIELEFEELDEDMKEVRLLEYARMMKLSTVERKIYFQNRLIFETELSPVSRFKKVAGWIVIIAYCCATAFYICLFGVTKGAQTTNAWLISFVLAAVQDFFLYIPLKILFMNVYLPALISKRLASISDPSRAENFKFSSFMPENAAVYVAMNHRELQASKLVLSRSRPGEDWAGGEDGWGEGEAAGKRGPNGRKMKRMTTARAATKVRALKMYTSKGCAKFGLMFFAAFVLLPDFVQVSLLDVIVPTAIGSIVYGNYQLYKMREWSPYTLNLALIGFVCGIVLYIRHQRHKKKVGGAQRDHASHFRNSVILEMAQIQLQSKPGVSINTGSLKKETQHRARFEGEEEGVINPLSPMGRGEKAGGGEEGGLELSVRGKQFAL